MTKAKLTIHAMNRVATRLSLLPLEVEAILDEGRTVEIGRNGHKVHRLFHSIPDDQPFVAVQDERDGHVLTVLPIDYHDLVAWRVPIDARMMARALMVPISDHARIPDEDRTTVLELGPGDHPRQVCRIVGYFRPHGDPWGFMKNLGSWPIMEKDTLEANPDFLPTIHGRIMKHHCQIQDLQEIWVQEGNNGHKHQRPLGSDFMTKLRSVRTQVPG